jgi:hypothetical protein
MPQSCDHLSQSQCYKSPSLLPLPLFGQVLYDISQIIIFYLRSITIAPSTTTMYFIKIAAIITTLAALCLATPVEPRETLAVLAPRQGQCPCPGDMCCSQYGYCGTGPAYCKLDRLLEGSNSNLTRELRWSHTHKCCNWPIIQLGWL